MGLLGIPEGFNQIQPQQPLSRRGLSQFSRGLGQFRKPNPMRQLIQQLALQQRISQFVAGSASPQTELPVSTEAPTVDVQSLQSSGDVRNVLRGQHSSGQSLSPEMIRLLLSRKRLLQNQELTQQRQERRAV